MSFVIYVENQQKILNYNVNCSDIITARQREVCPR